jgi:hypothetical protein
MRIIPEYFFLAFCIGILFVYLEHPKPQVIIKYPTPDNAGKVLYKDDAGVCYRYNKKQVKCPKNAKKIKELKPQQVESIVELMKVDFD